LLNKITDNLDFLIPQYYNGYVRSYTYFPGALSHFTTITDQMFGGDPSKVVYGFCINDCGTFNLDGNQSAQVMEWLSEKYPCNGGAFFWVANDDTDTCIVFVFVRRHRQRYIAIAVAIAIAVVVVVVIVFCFAVIIVAAPFSF
jgi:hypothetical protein